MENNKNAKVIQLAVPGADERLYEAKNAPARAAIFAKLQEAYADDQVFQAALHEMQQSHPEYLGHVIDSANWDSIPLEQTRQAIIDEAAYWKTP